ncbi:DUF4118 domain-containing protein [Dactylosporangium roseum]|uniref:histidine kinase n=1 Tax=Dactylosporangium roseum TaxID=47989 RepID=A0ABY5YW25_9ACTN|nr:DUF4118 domain-containing protein [Dactylosporangium roseum]UWZ33442.1 DUF4118 domain-containing protein [Dactylosporangium roseum]
MRAGPLSRLVRPTPPRLMWGIAFAVCMIAVETLVVYPLREISTEAALSMIYLIGVLVVSMVWGLWLGVAAAVASALAYVIFHVHPVGSIIVRDTREWAALVVFLAVAVLSSALADLSRLRAVEAQESDLTAEMARLLLNTDDVALVLPAVAHRVARALGLPSAAIELAAAPEDGRHWAFPLRDRGTCFGILRVPSNVPERTVRRLRAQVAPSLASLLRAGHERAAVLATLEASRERQRQLATEQAALGRVATLVAHGASPSEVFDAIRTELHVLLGEHITWLLRFERDGTASVVSTSLPGLRPDQMRWPVEGDSVLARVWAGGRPARVDSFEDLTGPGAALARELGIRSVVGVPVVVDGRLWGMAAVASARPDPLPADTEARVVDFVDLAAIAIANADSRAELAASRARLVAATDQTRKRIERDLHDGALQQFIAVGLRLGAVQAALPPELVQAKAELSGTLHSLNSAVDNLREISRGLHPAPLAMGGLVPAFKALARRSVVPVELDLDVGRRMPPVVEVAAYYVVSEALTNAARHAHASVVRVQAGTRGGALCLSIHDDGIGGADPGRGTGLTGLNDRVDALGGRVTVTSPHGGGTLLSVTIPIPPAESGTTELATTEAGGSGATDPRGTPAGGRGRSRR